MPSYIGTEPQDAYNSPTKDRFSGDASTTAFTLSRSVANAADLEVFVDNVQQEPTVAYTVSGTTLTFTGTPATGSNNIYAVHRAGGMQTMKIPTGQAGDFTTINASGAATIGGDLTVTGNIIGDVEITGTTPKLTIGDAGAEDSTLLFDGNAQDFYIALDDSADDLLIGLGSTVGTTPAIAIDENLLATFHGGITMAGTTPTLTIGDAGAEDTKIVFDGNAQDFYIALDDSADDLLIGLGSTVGTTPAISIDENLAISTYGDITMTGTTPTLTIGDAGAEDAKIVFDGNAQDFHVGLDDSADDLVIGVGNALGTTTAIAVDENAVVNFSNTPTVASAAAKFAGKESIWVPAGAMYPSTTNGCSALTQVETTALRPDLKVLDFAAAADDFAQFSIAFPKSWNEGTVTFQPFWTVTGTNTGTVAWALAGVAASSDDTINVAFGTGAVTTALAHSGTSNDLMVSAESGNITIAGSPAANDVCFFQISRDVSADNQTGAARLIGVKVFFTTDAGNDA